MWFHHRLDPDAVIRALQERLVARYPVFRWRPRLSECIGGRDEWVEDEDFDIHRHVTVHELGGAGGRAELQEFLEARFSEPIDRAHPLWRAYVLEGNDFGAVMIRFHHAIADGTALARVLIEMTTDTPEEGFDYPHVARGPPAPGRRAPGARGVPRRPDRPAQAGQGAQRRHPGRDPAAGRRREGHDRCGQAAGDAGPRSRRQPRGQGGGPDGRDGRDPRQARGGHAAGHRDLRQGRRRQARPTGPPPTTCRPSSARHGPAGRPSTTSCSRASRADCAATWRAAASRSRTP